MGPLVEWYAREMSRIVHHISITEKVCDCLVFGIPLCSYPLRHAMKVLRTYMYLSSDTLEFTEFRTSEQSEINV